MTAPTPPMTPSMSISLIEALYAQLHPIKESIFWRQVDGGSTLLLFADGGLLYDYFPYFTPPMDKLGIGLGLTLAVKESAFLLWILAAVIAIS